MVIIDGGEGGQGCGRPWDFTEVVVKPSLKTRAYERRQERGSQVAQRQRIHLPIQETQDLGGSWRGVVCVFRSLGQEDPLEEEIGTNSSILAWKIPCTEELGGLQSTGSQGVRHD